MWVLIYVLSWTNPAMTVGPTFNGQDRCVEAGKLFVSNNKTPFHAYYICTQQRPE